MQAQRVKNGPGALGGAVQGALGGASFMQSMNAAGYGKGETSGDEVADTGTNSTNPLPQQTAMQQPNMSYEDPYALQQRRYAQYGAPQQSTWPLMAQNYSR